MRAVPSAAVGCMRLGGRAMLAAAAPRCSWPSLPPRPTAQLQKRRCSTACRAAAEPAAATEAARDSSETKSSNSSSNSSGREAWQPPHFADLPLDRAGGLRRAGQKLQQLLEAPTTCVLLLHQHKLLVAPAGLTADANSSQSGSGSLPLAAHCFAAEGTHAPDGRPPRWLPLVASSQQLLKLELEDEQQQQQQEGGQQGIDFLFLGLDPQGHAVFAAQVPRQLLPLLPPVPPPRASRGNSGSGSGSGSSGTAATEAAAGTAGEVATTAATAPAAGDASSSNNWGSWVDVRKEGQRMTGPDAAVAALAAALVQWHGSAAFCSKTGAPMRVSSGGHSRTPQVEGVPAEGGRRPRSVYPRIDPAVIVAVGCGDWLLLGRKAAWEPGRYSCLAGFAEVGETLEQAVAREVQEESGVAVELSSVRYHSSQPWPFPQSLMIGFTAEAAEAADYSSGSSSGSSSSSSSGAGQPPVRRGLALLPGPAAAAAAREVGLLPSEVERYLLPRLPDVQVDPAELEDAKWLHATWLAAAVAAGGPPPVMQARASGSSSGGVDAFRIPGKYALANRIISSWLQERQQAASGGNGSGNGSSSGNSGAAPAGLAAPDAEATRLLGAVRDVMIDEGSFKYVLLRLSTADGSHSKLLVRGDSRAAYHNHIFQATAAEVRAAAPGLQLDTLGGGRIEHYPQQRAVAVYGFSSAFGQAPHDVTAALLRRWMPFHDISASYDGY